MLLLVEVAVMRSRSLRASILSGATAAGLALPAVAALAVPALAQGFGGFGSHPFGPSPFGPHPLGPGMWVVGGVFLLLRALLLIGLVALVWRALGAGTLWQRPDNATQLLRERYARGEIGEDEYRKRLGTLA